MKKFLITALSIALVALIAVGSTLAYLTDTEEQVNIMTVGKVDVELIEQQRDENGDLEDFEDGKVLRPLVGSAQGDKDKWGLSTAKNYVDKIIRAKNTGDYGAYVRILVAVPLITYENRNVSATNTSGNVIHSNYGNRFDENGTGAWNGEWAVAGNPFYDDFWDNDTMEFPADPITIDGQKYELMAFTYDGILMPGETTAAALAGFYLELYGASLTRLSFPSWLRYHCILHKV